MSIRHKVLWLSALVLPMGALAAPSTSLAGYNSWTGGALTKIQTQTISRTSTKFEVKPVKIGEMRVYYSTARYSSIVGGKCKTQIRPSLAFEYVATTNPVSPDVEAFVKNYATKFKDSMNAGGIKPLNKMAVLDDTPKESGTFFETAKYSQTHGYSGVFKLANSYVVYPGKFEQTVTSNFVSCDDVTGLTAVSRRALSPTNDPKVLARRKLMAGWVKHFVAATAGAVTTLAATTAIATAFATFFPELPLTLTYWEIVGCMGGVIGGTVGWAVGKAVGAGPIINGAPRWIVDALIGCMGGLITAPPLGPKLTDFVRYVLGGNIGPGMGAAAQAALAEAAGEGIQLANIGIDAAASSAVPSLVESSVSSSALGR